MSAAFGRIFLILGLFALSLPVAGCMAKARTLHVAVNEFKNESTAAVDSPAARGVAMSVRITASGVFSECARLPSVSR